MGVSVYGAWRGRAGYDQNVYAQEFERDETGGLDGTWMNSGGNENMVLYHASKEIVEFPEVRKTRYTKDFSWGFYLFI